MVEVEVKVEGAPSCPPIPFQQATVGDSGFPPKLRKLQTFSGVS